MARTYLTADNARHGKVTAAGGSYAHFCGWDAGVLVEVSTDAADSFRIYMTSGSNGSRGKVLLGTVKDTPEGPVFQAARKEEVSQ